MSSGLETKENNLITMSGVAGGAWRNNAVRSRRYVWWSGSYNQKKAKMHRVVRESLGAYRAVLLASLRLQEGECHTSHKADI